MVESQAQLLSRRYSNSLSNKAPATFRRYAALALISSIGDTACSTSGLTLSNTSKQRGLSVNAASASGAMTTQGPTLPHASRIALIVLSCERSRRAAMLATAHAWALRLPTFS